MADETMAKSILAIPGMRDLLLAQLGISPAQPDLSSSSSKVKSTHDIDEDRGRSRIRTPPPSNSQQGSSSAHTTKRIRSTSPEKAPRGINSKNKSNKLNKHNIASHTSDSGSRTQHRIPEDDPPCSSRSPSRSWSPSQSRSQSRSRLDSIRAGNASAVRSSSPALERPASNESKGKRKRKRSPSPTKTGAPDEYDRSYSSYEPGTVKKRGGRVKYIDENGEEKIKFTQLELLRTREEKDAYVRKHGHPYSARVGFKFNPYAKKFAEGELRLIARPKGDMGRAFKPHEIAGWRTDYDEYLNYRDDLRSCLIKYEPQNLDLGEGDKVTWSHYGGTVRQRIYRKMEEKRPILKCFRNKTGDDNWFVRDTAQMYLSQANTYNHIKNRRGRDKFIRRNKSGGKAIKIDDGGESDGDNDAGANLDDGGEGGFDEDAYANPIPSGPSSSTSRDARRADKIAAEEEARAERLKAQEKASKKGKLAENGALTKNKAPVKVPAKQLAKPAAKGPAKAKAAKKATTSEPPPRESDSEPDEEPELDPELEAIRNSGKSSKTSRQIVEVVLKSPAKRASPAKASNKRRKEVEEAEEEDPAPKKAKPNPNGKSKPPSDHGTETEEGSEEEPEKAITKRVRTKRRLAPTPTPEPEQEPEELEDEPKPATRKAVPKMRPPPVPITTPEEELEEEPEQVVNPKQTTRKPRPITRVPPSPSVTPNSTPIPEPPSASDSKVDELEDDNSTAEPPLRGYKTRSNTRHTGLVSQPTVNSDGLRVVRTTTMLVRVGKQGTKK